MFFSSISEAEFRLRHDKTWLDDAATVPRGVMVRDVYNTLSPQSLLFAIVVGEDIVPSEALLLTYSSQAQPISPRQEQGYKMPTGYL